MKKLTYVIGKIVFYAFVLVVALFTASLTLAEVKQILPGDNLTPLFALSLFDGGAIAWLLAFTGHAKGLIQRAISIIMLVVDLLGVALLSSARLWTGGQTLADAPEQIGNYVIWGIVGATLLNLAAIYIFHMTDPDVLEGTETGVLMDTLRDEAMKQAQASIEQQAQQLGAVMAARATGLLKYNLRLPMSTDEAQHVIEAQARDVETKQPATRTKRPNIITRWIHKTARALAPVEPVMIVNQHTTSAPGALEKRAAAIVADQPAANLYDAVKQGIDEAQHITDTANINPSTGAWEHADTYTPAKDDKSFT